MHPEEPLVPPLTDPFPNRLASILPHELANHRLCDRVDNCRIRRLAWTSVGDGEIGISGIRVVNRTRGDVC